jgi:hypothetical protein
VTARRLRWPISSAASSQAGADPPASGYHDIDFGDYTGSAFVNGVLMPVWADNSNSTGDNPDGTLGRFDLYTASILVQTPQPRSLTALGPAKVWLGLKNSDDVGLRFDLLATVFVGTTKVGEGRLDNVPAGSSGFNNALLKAIPLAVTGSPAPVPPDASLRFTVAARRTCAGDGHDTGTARLWYNGSGIDSGARRGAGTRFDATIAESTTTYFLRESFALDTAGGTSNRWIDKLLTSRLACPDRPFTSFGTWSIAIP